MSEQETILVVDDDREIVGAIAAALEKEGIRILSVAQYYENPEEKRDHIFVMNYSSLKKENIKMAIQGLEKVFVGKSDK